MNQDTTLINFNVPNHIKFRFDKVCQLAGKTRTSVLVDLMNDYILTQGERLMIFSQRMDMIDQRLDFEFENLEDDTSDHDHPPRFFSGYDDSNW